MHAHYTVMHDTTKHFHFIAPYMKLAASSFHGEDFSPTSLAFGQFPDIFLADSCQIPLPALTDRELYTAKRGKIE